MHAYAEAIKNNGARANNTFMTLGIEPVSFGNGEAVLSLKVTEKLHNGAGVLQGGIFVVLGDEAMALAIHGDMEAGENAVTVSETTEFIRGIAAGTVEAHAKITKKGRRIIFAEAEVREAGDSGRILSRTVASFMVV
ncbi:MAG TPA: PaaI family thioesterase [Methanocorpusculum sp.]|nr:PaaI family thioesterase [Methanocorpusculum sp.]